jgi:ubiquinone/menaquinone biosynthesis C-methylase UbiE
MSQSDQHPPYKAYARLAPARKAQTGSVADLFDALLDTARKVESPLLCDIKPVIALALKWKFDYLAKTLESPLELERDILYWIDLLKMFKRLGDERWFDLAPRGEPPMDVWKRTAHGFDVGWTTTTAGERFQASQQIARERLEQISGMLGGNSWFAGKDILDSGCGPGRYVDLLAKLSPRRLVGLDQGPALIEALQSRFKGQPVVEIVRGTCEKLTFPDASFDFVLSNGVIHHTAADLRTMIADHCRVLRKGGAMFIMLVGKGGLELEIWEFLRAFLYDVPIETMLDRFGKVMSPLRLQGVVDHMYGEYQETDRAEFEKWCAGLFAKIERVPGVEGLDVTPEVYRDDPYFAERFGTGQLRYLCHK